ncbi:hypothetical protein M3148_04805 [Georgenia satyanarayanai]|uniref:hypothetical protein n=1 Tax=Georgenia satyanarayanai TaxID=860221 RepID=UPI002040B1A4|nr:hypothetical protein [Georgenia satyanarayanai]MCM3660317.1 hypothetical protein [Georgenia satyanarayanai]
MKSTHGARDRAADRILALDSASYGDERERAVFMEATTFGYMLTIYVSIAVAVVAAVLGQLLLPVLLLLLLGLQSWATVWYAGRRGVDVSDLAFRAEANLKRNAGIAVFGGFALVLAALAYTIFAGHGLIDLPAVDVRSGAVGSMVKGAVIGGGGGLLVGALAMGVKNRRRAHTGEPGEHEVPEED